MLTPHDAALFAQRAYADAPTIGAAASASRVHVYLLDDGTTAHVFRGTDDAMSALADANITLADVPSLGRIHAGFYAALVPLLPALLALPRPSVVIGHSLGAAMALDYGAILALTGEPVPIFAFEPPRLCADDQMRQLFAQRHVPVYACRNGRDLVTQVPPELTLPVPLTAIGNASFVFDNIADHAIERVIEALAV